LGGWGQPWLTDGYFGSSVGDQLGGTELPGRSAS
jgi:hypothetical protein